MAKGLEVAHSFFSGWGLEYLKGNFPRLVDRVAAILCHGSQTLGNDDELSQDHGWGPTFSLVLTATDMRQSGQLLLEQINKNSPDDWQGMSRRTAPKIDVSSINPWFKGLVGRARPPSEGKSWLGQLDEDYLCMLRHAAVFHDPLGEWSARRTEFSSYPLSDWKQIILGELFNVWHHGEYNFLQRLTQRDDEVLRSIALAKFSEGVMRMSLAMAHEFRPYWKWVPAQFRKLPDAAGLNAKLEELASTQTTDRRAEIVRSACADLHAELVSRFGVDSNPTWHPHPLLCAREELISRRDKGQW